MLIVKIYICRHLSFPYNKRFTSMYLGAIRRELSLGYTKILALGYCSLHYGRSPSIRGNYLRFLKNVTNCQKERFGGKKSEGEDETQYNLFLLSERNHEKKKKKKTKIEAFVT